MFDLFSVGIGPSSSHTVGPMRAAFTFVTGLAADGQLEQMTRVHVELFGSLGATGRGHGSDKAVVLGLEGERPETVDTASVGERFAAVRAAERICLLGRHEVDFGSDDLVLNRRISLPFHPNGLRFTAFGATGAVVRERTYYSVGGGFVVNEAEAGAARIVADTTEQRYPFDTGVELLERCAEARATDQRGDDGERDGLADAGRGARRVCCRSGG